jgi:hypothetical protein
MDELRIREFTENSFNKFVERFDLLRNNVVSKLNDKLDKFVNEKMSYDAENWEYPEILKKTDLIYKMYNSKSGIRTPADLDLPNIDSFNDKEIVLVLLRYIYGVDGKIEQITDIYYLNIYGEWMSRDYNIINKPTQRYKIPKFIVDFIKGMIMINYQEVSSNVLAQSYNSYNNFGHSIAEPLMTKRIINSAFIDQFLRYNIDVPQNQKYLNLMLENQRLLSENEDLVERSKFIENEMSNFENWRESQARQDERSKALDEKEETLKKRIMLFNIKRKQLEDKEKELKEKEEFYNKLSEL